MNKTVNAAGRRWSIGQRVMVPLHGICTILSFPRDLILGQEMQLVELSPDLSGTRVKLPVSALDGRSVRPLLRSREMERVLAAPEGEPEPPSGDAHQRLADWVSRLRSGGPGVRHRILCEIAVVENRGEPLTQEERRFRDRLSLSLRQEIEQALHLSPSHARRKLNRSVQGSLQT